MISRRDWILSSLAGAASLLITKRVHASAPTVITVYKDPGCECCTQWVKHLSANGFVATVRDVRNMDEVKQLMHIPQALQSCHTAVVGQYVIEGHVPAAAIRKFLAARPKAYGLAVPGMPMGSPGMEGGRAQHYDVLVFDRDGTSRVYEKH